MKVEIFKTLRQVIRWLGILGITYFVTDMFIKLGQYKVLKFDVIINSLINISASVYISYTIAFSAVIYGYRQQKLRRKNIKEMSERIDYFERRLWEKKLSSKINKDGTTREEDND